MLAAAFYWCWQHPVDRFFPPESVVFTGVTSVSLRALPGGKVARRACLITVCLNIQSFGEQGRFCAVFYCLKSGLEPMPWR